MDNSANFIGPAERLLFLRAMDTFSDLPAEELSLLASQANEYYASPRARLLHAGVPPASVYLVSEGVVSFRRDGHSFRRVEAPALVGTLPLLAGETQLEIVAETDVTALQIAARTYLDLLEENFGMLESTIRGLSKTVHLLQRQLEIAGQWTRPAGQPSLYRAEQLTLAQKLLVLRKTGPYARANLSALMELADRASEVRAQGGDLLWAEGDPAEWGGYIVCGAIAGRSEGGKGAFIVGAGEPIGLTETYGRLRRTYTATAVEPTVLLKEDTETLLDLLEENGAFGIEFAGFLAALVLDLSLVASRADAATLPRS
jgi:CRP-like cAMP-binding protein